MKLKYHKLLSSFAFNFNLRRYNTELFTTNENLSVQLEEAHAHSDQLEATLDATHEVGRCRLTPD